MATINLGELYNYYLNKYQDKKTAAQYTAFQYLSNPSGSVAGLKEPQKWYSQDEWYEYEAPAFLAIKNYSGDDPLNQYVSKAINESKNLAELQTKLRKVSNKDYWDKGYENIQKIELGKTYDINTNDLINQATTLWSQKESADKKYKTQIGTHPFSQFGLPDPNLRFTVYTDPNATTKKFPPGQKPTYKKTQYQDTSKYVPYKPALDYINKSTQTFGDTLAKKGLSKADVAKYTVQYKTALQAAVQKQLDDSELSPFVQKVLELRKIRKP